MKPGVPVLDACDDRRMSLARAFHRLRSGPTLVVVLLLTLCAGTAEAAGALRISGERFVTADGTPFEWRGATAFRLAELVANGRERDADAYLAWAQAQQLTIVRVLAMAHNLFELPPDRGRPAMARLLTMAAARGLAIEIVALADTASLPFDIDAHVRELGQICARAGLCTIEIANEPNHPTQDRRLHDPKYLAALRRLVPAEVPCALGADTSGDDPRGGDYVTAHFPRHDGWKHVAALAEGFALRQRFKAPVISDEPIGAARQAVPGSRDADPERFRAAALLSRMAGLGATFHYDGGLQAVIPAGNEEACFTAWRSAWDLLPRAPITGFRELKPSDPITLPSAPASAWIGQAGSGLWVLAIGTSGPTQAAAGQGWRLEANHVWPSSALLGLKPAQPK